MKKYMYMMAVLAIAALFAASSAYARGPQGFGQGGMMMQGGDEDPIHAEHRKAEKALQFKHKKEEMALHLENEMKRIGKSKECMDTAADLKSLEACMGHRGGPQGMHPGMMGGPQGGMMHPGMMGGPQGGMMHPGMMGGSQGGMMHPGMMGGQVDPQMMKRMMETMLGEIKPEDMESMMKMMEGYGLRKKYPPGELPD